MQTNKIKHQRYLTMAETIGDVGGLILLSAAGKILNVVPAHRLTSLIPHGTEMRGAVIYAATKPGYVSLDYLIERGAKEIYFSAEGSSMALIEDAHIEGINFEDLIDNLRAEIQSPGDGLVSDPKGQ